VYATYALVCRAPSRFLEDTSDVVRYWNIGFHDDIENIVTSSSSLANPSGFLQGGLSVVTYSFFSFFFLSFPIEIHASHLNF
jgi:hypothetical protein